MTGTESKTMLLWRAKRLARRGNAEGVIDALLPLVDEQADDPVVLALYAAARFQTGDLPRAIEAYDRTLAADPSHRVARFQLGLALASLPEHQAAVAAWAPLLDDEAEFMAHFHSAQSLLALGRPANAAPLLETARRRMPREHPLSDDLDKIMALGMDGGHA